MANAVVTVASGMASPFASGAISNPTTTDPPTTEVTEMRPAANVAFSTAPNSVAMAAVMVLTKVE